MGMTIFKPLPFLLALLAVFFAVPMLAFAADGAPSTEPLVHVTNQVGKWLLIVSPVLIAMIHFVQSPDGGKLLDTYGPRAKRIVITALAVAAAAIVGFGSDKMTMSETIALALLSPVTTLGLFELGPKGILRRAIPGMLISAPAAEPQMCAHCGQDPKGPPPAPPAAV